MRYYLHQTTTTMVFEIKKTRKRTVVFTVLNIMGGLLDGCQVMLKTRQNGDRLVTSAHLLGGTDVNEVKPPVYAINVEANGKATKKQLVERHEKAYKAFQRAVTLEAL